MGVPSYNYRIMGTKNPIPIIKAPLLGFPPFPQGSPHNMFVLTFGEEQSVAVSLVLSRERRIKKGSKRAPLKGSIRVPLK